MITARTWEEHERKKARANVTLLAELALRNLITEARLVEAVEALVSRCHVLPVQALSVELLCELLTRLTQWRCTSRGAQTVVTSLDRLRELQAELPPRLRFMVQDMRDAQPPRAACIPPPLPKPPVPTSGAHLHASANSSSSSSSAATGCSREGIVLKKDNVGTKTPARCCRLLANSLITMAVKLDEGGLVYGA